MKCIICNHKIYSTSLCYIFVVLVTCLGPLGHILVIHECQISSAHTACWPVGVTWYRRARCHDDRHACNQQSIYLWNYIENTNTEQSK